ncbi:MAG TPA: orotidine-5'-phosphate decarboxylase [Candidatus Polarisedimenticolaceae bacterium]|nr:orotidine-5'-phosphate decarboxylase [Candidatus Polarisedimenticolaceae bacterium]
MTPRDRVFVALDTPDRAEALALARRLAGKVGGFKIGLQAFVACGPPLVLEIREMGHEVFLDLKLHDIPNTVLGAAAAAAALDVQFLTVHALGGGAMIERAVSACGERTIVLAVTILTSHDDAALATIGIEGPASSAVPRLAAIARDAGAGGVVCSPLEIAAARAAHPRGVIVVPGIRPAGPRAPDDQARVATPASALAAGADRLVIGRPITAAADPVAAADAIAEEIADVARR